MQRIQHRLQNEFSELRGVGLFVRGRQRPVVPGLLVMHHTFDGQIRHLRLPLRQNDRLKQSANPAIAIAERVNELDLVMHHGSRQQRVKVGLLEPLKQIFDQIRHAICGRSHVDEFGALINAHPAPAECSRSGAQSLHQGSMGLEKIRHRRGFERFHQLVGHKRVLHLLDLPRQPAHPLAGNDRSNLVETQRVVLDGKRRVNAANAILPPQAWRHPAFRRLPPAQRFANPADQVDQPGRYREWWGVGHG